MIKKCANPHCKKEFDGSPRKKYCSPKCKKFVENSKRGTPGKKAKTPSPEKKRPPSDNGNHTQSSNVTKPDTLNPVASAHWDKLAPILIQRGHLNVLSEDAFAELCDLHSRLVDIRLMIDTGTVVQCEECGAEVKMPGNRSLLQLDDKWTINDGTQTQTFKESALSDLKRKYSARYLDYCKQFYLTPAANRGNFGLENEEPPDKEDGKSKERFF